MSTTTAAVLDAKNLDAEQSILGGILIRPDVLASLPHLEVDDFFDARNGAVFAAMRVLEASGTAIDAVTVASVLSDRQSLEAVGGWGYLGELVLRVPTPDNVERYAEIIRQHRITRDVLMAASTAEGHARNGSQGEDLLAEVLGELERVERPSLKDKLITVASASSVELAAIDRWFKDPASRVNPSLPWRIKTLDADTGGLPIGVVTAIGARPGVGKTTLLLNFVMRRIPDEPGLLISNEDSLEELTIQFLAWQSKINSRRIRERTLSADERDRLVDAQRELDSRMRFVRVVVDSSMGAQEMRRLMASEKRKRGARWGAIDYLQNIRRHGKHESLTLAVREDMQLFQSMTLDLNVGWIVVSQFNRESQKGGAPGKSDKPPKSRRPMLHDFADSTSIEACCKLALALHRDPEKPSNVIEIGVLKNRRAAAGASLWSDYACAYENSFIGSMQGGSSNWGSQTP